MFGAAEERRQQVVSAARARLSLPSRSCGGRRSVSEQAKAASAAAAVAARVPPSAYAPERCPRSSLACPVRLLQPHLGAPIPAAGAGVECPRPA